MKSCPFPTGNTLHKIWCDARWLVFENEMREFREFAGGQQWSEEDQTAMRAQNKAPMAFNRIKGMDQADIDRLICGQEFIDDGQRVSPLDMQRKEGDRFKFTNRGLFG